MIHNFWECLVCGTYEANNAMHDCDLMINIGARFDDRITGKVDEFSQDQKKFMLILIHRQLERI